MDFTRGWHTHLSLPQMTSPLPHCPSSRQPCLHCQELAEHPSQGNATSQGQRMLNPPWEGRERLLEPPQKMGSLLVPVPYPAPSPSHPNSAWARRGEEMGWVGTLGPIPRIYKWDLPMRGHPHRWQSQAGL